MRGALAAVAVATMVGIAPAPAVADPENPTTVSEAQKRAQELTRELEMLTEEWHKAKDELAARQQEQEKAKQDAEQARKAAEEARAAEAEFRVQVDKLASASYQGARFNQLAALLVSESPQEFLEQMSALDLLAADNKAALDRLRAVVDQAEAAERQAREAEERATRAAEEAARLEAEAAQRKDEAKKKADEAKAAVNRLTEAERRAMGGGTIADGDIKVAPGSGKAYQAMQIALNQRGKPYQWGAEGPNSFDCSGLVYYSFKQVGITLPRSSRAQATVGVPVPRNQLQPGDLVFFYNPISHVGIYIGNGQMVHAPQEGQPVKVASINSAPYNTARRVG